MTTDGIAEEPPKMGEENPFFALRRFARRTTAKSEERCDLCGEAIGPEHRHLLNVAVREVLCACRACSFLLEQPNAGGARRLIPTRRLRLANFDMTDEQWASLQVPVDMAFFRFNTAGNRVTAFYPSPMGPTESLPPVTAWEELVERNPILQGMEPDVEALLVNREENETVCYLVPIDECFRLVGLIRLYWKGLSGGTEVRREIAQFFIRLEERAELVGDVHA